MNTDGYEISIGRGIGLCGKRITVVYTSIIRGLTASRAQSL
ncbi:MAG: hypothetical protein ACLQJ7_05960 [Syntrophobacteraceae bacterium]